MREADVSHGTLRELECLADGLKGNCIKDVNASISETSGQKTAWKADQKTHDTITPPSKASAWHTGRSQDWDTFRIIG